KKHGWHLKTGFSQIDAVSGGLAPGLILLAGEDREQLVDFLKQLVDQIGQIAADSKGPCLYLSFERTKATLRLQTLSRLCGVSTADIEKGRFAKDSAKWREIVRAGEHAVEWLQRIYVVETRPGLSVTRIRELRQSLLDSGAGAPRVIAIDNLDKLANESDLLHSVAELKELAEALEVVVVGVVKAMELVHERSADMAATFQGKDDATVINLTTTGSTAPNLLRFEHRRATHRFEERPRTA
ncbi:MAG: DnaB-like helicase C-terminal domain-containing protein, partial [Vicinamibacteria bacterium]